jgi:hypothetical protein
MAPACAHDPDSNDAVEALAAGPAMTVLSHTSRVTPPPLSLGVSRMWALGAAALPLPASPTYGVCGELDRSAPPQSCAHGEAPERAVVNQPHINASARGGEHSYVYERKKWWER